MKPAPYNSQRLMRSDLRDTPGFVNLVWGSWKVLAEVNRLRLQHLLCELDSVIGLPSAQLGCDLNPAEGWVGYDLNKFECE